MNTGQHYLEVPQGIYYGEQGQQDVHQTESKSPQQEAVTWWSPETTPSSVRNDNDLPEALPAEFQSNRHLPECVPFETNGYSNLPQKNERIESPQDIKDAYVPSSPEPSARRRRRRWLLIGTAVVAVVIIGLVAGLLGGLLTRHKKSSS